MEFKIRFRPGFSIIICGSDLWMNNFANKTISVFQCGVIRQVAAWDVKLKSEQLNR